MASDDWLDQWDGPDLESSASKSEFDEEAYNDAQEVPICPGLYIGGLSTASNKKWLDDHKITHVLVAGALLKAYFPTDFEYKHIKCLDTSAQDLLSYFPEGNAFIRKALSEHGAVLVHCQYGVSRSAAFAIAYVMSEKQMPFDQAYDVVHKARPFIEPNSGFIRQLRLFEEMGYRVNKDDPRYKQFRKETMM